MKEFMCTKGIRLPTPNRITNGLADAAGGPEVPGGVPGNSLIARDFAQWGLNSFEDYIIKDDKPESRSRPPSVKTVISMAISLQMKISGSVYGEERNRERMEAKSFVRDLHESCGEFFAPAFSMSVWGEMTFEYSTVVTEGIRRMIQALPHGPRVGDSKKERTPRTDGAAAWKFPVTFKTTSPLGLRKS